MGAIIVNGKKFAGNHVAIRGGKVVVDGKVQGGKLRGKINLTVTDIAKGRAQSTASVERSAEPGNAKGAIRAVAFASANSEPGKGKKR